MENKDLIAKITPAKARAFMEKNIVTINDVAKDLNCSTTTISRAISGKGRVSEKTRERILSYIEEKGYSPNLIAKSLAQSKTYNIGVVLPKDANSIEMPFFQKCLMGSSNMAASMDYDIVVITMDKSDISQIERVIRNRKVDGMILSKSIVNDPAVSLLKQHAVPFIVIGSFHDADVLQTDHNHKQAAYELVSRILETNRRRIAFIGEDLDSIVNLNRYQGYVDAMTAADVKLLPELTDFVEDRNEIASAVNKLMAVGAECILCIDDFVCLHVLRALSAQKLRVPEDIGIASLYNSVYLSSYTPAISAINFDAIELGSTACELLLKHLSGHDVPPKTLLNYEIVTTESLA